MNMISATGRNPSSAAPIAAPTIAVSEIGVSRTRAAPCFVDRPRVSFRAPPAGSATSSPRMMTFGSDDNARSSAWLIARDIEISAMGHVRQQRRGVRCGSGEGGGERVLDRGVGVGVDLRDVGGQARLVECGPEG